MSLAIRAAVPADAALIFALVRELADYEKLSGEIDATPEAIAAALFSTPPRLFCDIAEWNGAPAGFSVWFLNFSTFRGRHGIYVEDLFVRPAFRAKGIGKALMARLAKRCVDEGLGALRMGGARLERAIDRLLQVDRRPGHGRVADLPFERASLARFCLAGLRQ